MIADRPKFERVCSDRLGEGWETQPLRQGDPFRFREGVVRSPC
jgi:hypothetical protein